MTIADQLLSISNTKDAIKTAIEAKGVTVGSVPFASYPSKIAAIETGTGTTKSALEWSQAYYDNIVAQITPYSRPSDWLTLPTLTDASEKVVGLIALFPGKTPVALTAAGAFTVNWGDGNIVNYAADEIALHIYDYTTYDVANLTYCSRGYKQAIITITPQSGQAFTKIDLSLIPSISRLITSYPPYLDLSVAGANLTTITFTGTSSNKFVYLEQLRVYRNNANLGSLCKSFPALRSVPILDATGSPSLAQTFYECFSLTYVNIINTSLVTTVANMFAFCYSITAIPFFDTSQVTDATSMIQSCINLKGLPLYNFSQVTNMTYFATGCTVLEAIPPFTNLHATSYYSAFSQTSIETLPPFNVAGSNISYLCNYCRNLVEFPPLVNINTCFLLTQMLMGSGIQSVRDVDLSGIADLSGIFSACLNLVSVINVDCSGATTLVDAFNGCSRLREVSLITSAQLTTIAQICYSCSDLQSFTLSNSINVNDMTSAFYGCAELSDLNLSAGMTPTLLQSTFNGCRALKTLPNLNTQYVTTMESAFAGCFALTALPAFTYPLVTTLASFCTGCRALRDIPALSIPNVTTLASAFSDCENISSIVLTDTSKVTTCSLMLNKNSALQKFSMDNTTSITTHAPFTQAPMLSSCILANSRQGSISWLKCHMDYNTIQNLIEDALAYISARTWTLTNNIGLNDNVSLSLSGSTVLGSDVITIDTTDITAGMSIAGTGIPNGTAKTITTFATTDIATLTGHGLIDGTKIYIRTILTSTTLNAKTPYYLVNVTANTFQLSLTRGGAPISFGLSANKSSVSIGICTEVSAILSATTLRMTAAATSTATSTLTIQSLKAAQAAAKYITLTL